jgi:hypothetical protein
MILNPQLEMALREPPQAHTPNVTLCLLVTLQAQRSLQHLLTGSPSQDNWESHRGYRSELQDIFSELQAPAEVDDPVLEDTSIPTLQAGWPKAFDDFFNCEPVVQRAILLDAWHSQRALRAVQTCLHSIHQCTGCEWSRNHVGRVAAAFWFINQANKAWANEPDLSLLVNRSRPQSSSRAPRPQ